MCNVFKNVYKVEMLHCNVFTSIVGVVKSIVGVVRNDSLGAKKKNSLTKS
jgi:hypothetical protein